MSIIVMNFTIVLLIYFALFCLSVVYMLQIITYSLHIHLCTVMFFVMFQTMFHNLAYFILFNRYYPQFILIIYHTYLNLSLCFI